MKNLTTLILSAELTWRTNLLKPLVEQDAQVVEYVQAQGLKKRGRPKKDDRPPTPASVPLVKYEGLQTRFEIPAVYWKLALMARVFGAESMFELRQRLEWVPDRTGWLAWLGAEQAHELLELPPLVMRAQEFVDLLTEKVYGVLCRGTKPISRQDVTRFVREFYALGKGKTRRVSPADHLRERYERDVKAHGMGVGTFLERVLWSRDRLVSQDGGHWRDEPQLSPKQTRRYNQLLRSRSNPVDQELSRINEHLSFDFVAALLGDRYKDGGAPAYHPVFMWKIVFLGWLRGITSPGRLQWEIHDNLSYRKFLGLGLKDRVATRRGPWAEGGQRSTIWRFIVFRLMPHIDEVFHLLVHRCKEAGLLSDRLCGDGYRVVGQERKKSDALVRNLDDLRTWAQEFVFAHLQQAGRSDLSQDEARALLDASEHLDEAELGSLSKHFKASVHTVIAQVLEESGIDVGQILTRRDGEAEPEQVQGDDQELSDFERELFQGMSAFVRKHSAGAFRPRGLHYKEGYSLQVYHDPEGGARRKYDLTIHGYGVQLLVDAKARVIVDVRVFPNNERFRKHFADQVLEVKARYEYGQIVVSSDSEFTRSSVIHDLSQAPEVTLYGPLAVRQNKYKKAGLFGGEEFELEVHEGERYLRCPGGVVLARVQKPHEEDGTMLETPCSAPLRGTPAEQTFRGKPSDCKSCALTAQCRGGDAPRTVKRDVYREEVEAHAERMRAPEARVIMGVHRAAAEGAVGELKRHRLLDRARQKGLARLMYQAYLCAIVTNTKRLVRALEKQRCAGKPG